MTHSIDEDSRDQTLKNLDELLNDTLRASLIAQLCARGLTLSDAIDKHDQLSQEEMNALIKADGGSGYLEFQWLSESIIKVKSAINKINLHDFWEFVKAKRSTKTVYEEHLLSALEPINRGTSGIRTNLQELYDDYPGNKVTSESLPILRQVQESTNKIEHIINKLINLSPPVKTMMPRISSKLIYGILFLSLISIPFLYWLDISSSEKTEATLTSTIEQNIKDVKKVAQDDPVNLPALIFTNIIPMTSNLLLLISALLGIVRVFSADSRKDTKSMSEELAKAGKLLRDLG